MSETSDRLEGLRVMIVEDELLIAMELETALRKLGCIPLDPVPTVRQALRALDEDRPDFAVLDVNLRGERVTPVAERLAEQSIPFVLVTGYGSERLPEPALQAAVVLRKPVEGRRLASAIRERLAGERTRPGT